jgi:phosphatidate cytidylyltransferase
VIDEDRVREGAQASELPTSSHSNLALRVASALVLAPLAIGTAYVGGVAFVVLWGLAALGILWEWRRIVADTGYATIGLRSDSAFGFWAILYLFAIVWATDILGYFVGRWIGGPKLSPRLSPKKTWSGALGGALGAVLAGAAVTRYAGIAHFSAIVGLGLILSAVAQSGDLFESGVKRRFGTKDAGHVIPGHGGFMDRLDGFLAAALAAAIIGIARGGLNAPARGLLVW